MIAVSVVNQQEDQDEEEIIRGTVRFDSKVQSTSKARIKAKQNNIP